MPITRISWILAAIALLGAASAHAQAPAGSYAQTCGNVRVSGNVLHARCRTMAGAMVDTQLNLPCRGSIDNINGRLMCADAPAVPVAPAAIPPGSYLATCTAVRVQNGVLYASCRRANQSVAAASLPLPCNSGIDNLNGVLTCRVPPGSYIQTCADVRVQNGVLYANCRRANQTVAETSLRLPCSSGRIDNLNGVLTCR